MQRRSTVVLAYVALVICSLPIPLLHQHLTDRAIESMRPVMRMPNGSLVGMLMPADILFLRWLGEFSQWAACAVFVCFVFSFGKEQFSRVTTICAIAICECAFTTLYALYATFLLAEWWLQRAA